jgi:hypothetical protein
MGRGLKRLVVGMIAAAGVTVLAAPSNAHERASKKRGQVSVGAAAFTDDSGDEDCRVAKAAYAFYLADPEAGDADCDLVAGIQLPHRAELTSLTCSLYDGQLANAIEAHLVRVDLATGESVSVFTTAGTVDSGLQLVGDSAPEPGTSLVDNGSYAYYVAAAFSYSDFGSELRVYGCTVSYE